MHMYMYMLVRAHVMHIRMHMGTENKRSLRNTNKSRAAITSDLLTLALLGIRCYPL